MKEISISKVKDLLVHFISTNAKLQEAGSVPIAVGIEGAAGLGKTSIVRQLAEERGMGFVKLNLAQIDEPGDLTGYPIVEYECQVARKVVTEDGTMKAKVMPGTTWINTKQLDQKENGVLIKQTGKTRMGYAKPSWVPDYNENGTILLLDDYTRANAQILQAAMDLILEQKYISWELPKKTTIVLTTNGDDGTHNVNSLDEAQATRFINFTVGWDADTWARWAENNNVDGRCINFILTYSSELFSANEEGRRIANPRSYTMFAQSIANIPDWESDSSLGLINTISKGCFYDEEGRFSTMFSLFLKHKMHLIIQPAEMLDKDWKSVKHRLETLLYSEGNFRPDIASILERRFVNYVNAKLDSGDKLKMDVVKQRLLDFMNNDVPLFTKDLYQHMLKSITSEHKRQTSCLLFEPRIAEVLL